MSTAVRCDVCGYIENGEKRTMFSLAWGLNPLDPQAPINPFANLPMDICEKCLPQKTLVAHHKFMEDTEARWKKASVGGPLQAERLPGMPGRYGTGF